MANIEFEDVISARKYIGNLIIEYPEMIFDFDVIICNDFEGEPCAFEENESMWIKIEDLLKQEKI